MLGPPKLRCLDQPIAVSLEALVPTDNFYRYLDAKLNLTFVREWVQDCYADGGRPSIDPVVFFKLQLILFFEGIRSERRLMETVALNLAHRWYVGYAFDEPLPDHSSLTRIRTRLGVAVFHRFFEHVVELCQQAGLVWGKELFFDGTKVEANADIDSLLSRWKVAAQAHLTDLFNGRASGSPPWALPETEDGAAPSKVPSQTAVPTETDADMSPAVSTLPSAGTTREAQDLAARNRTRWNLVEERRRQPDQPSGSRGYQRMSDAKVSTSDPDAVSMRRFTGDQPKLGYHDHYVVDGGKARIILTALITPADVMDNTPMVDLFRRVCFRWKLRPERVVGDAKYGTLENIRALEDAGVRAYVPLMDVEGRSPYYGPGQFVYDAEHDEYRCPQGQPLRRYTVRVSEETVVYRANAAMCRACSVKDACTGSQQGRQVHRSFYASYQERVRSYHQTEAYRKAMRKRKVWVEPLFGEAKQWHGLQRFRLRGLMKVNTEGLLIAAGQNLKRWLARTGWGQRHGPCGSLVVFSTHWAGLLA